MNGRWSAALALALLGPVGCGDSDEGGAGTGSDPSATSDGAGSGTGTGTGMDDEPEPDRTDEVYDPDVVQTFELEIAEADLQAQLDALPERIYVPAKFTWNDVVVENVGVRFKGNSSSSPNQTHKRSFLIKFNEFVKGQLFLGKLRRLSIDNGIQFGSLFSERLVTDILRTLDVTTMRTNYCRIVVNGEYRGVYVNTERIDKSFLERYFADPQGPLFKVDEGGPGADLTYHGDDPAAYGMTFEPKSMAADTALPELIEFLRMIEETSDAEIPSALPAAFEVEPFLQSMPVLAFAGAFDQYTGWNAHNYYLYKEPGTDTWLYLNWDLDVGFADNAFGMIPVLDGWNVAYPYPVAPRPLLRRIVENDAWLADYRARADEVLETHFHPDVIVPRLYELYELIEPDLADDPFPPVRATNPTDTDYASILMSLEAFMEARYAKARAELDNPVDTPPDEPDGGGVDPAPGMMSPEDPTNLRVVSTSSSHVELAWDDNTPDEITHIVQRCTGSGCSDFVNHIGLPGPDIATAIDNGVTAGTTYAYRVYAMRPIMGMPGGTGPSNVVEATPN